MPSDDPDLQGRWVYKVGGKQCVVSDSCPNVVLSSWDRKLCKDL